MIRDGELSLYVFATPEGLLLATMENHDPEAKVPVYGAVEPGFDANYYEELCVSAARDSTELQYALGAEGWLGWLREALEDGRALMDEDFPFCADAVDVIELKGTMPGEGARC